MVQLWRRCFQEMISRDVSRFGIPQKAVLMLAENKGQSTPYTGTVCTISRLKRKTKANPVILPPANLVICNICIRKVLVCISSQLDWDFGKWSWVMTGRPTWP